MGGFEQLHFIQGHVFGLNPSCWPVEGWDVLEASEQWVGEWSRGTCWWWGLVTSEPVRVLTVVSESGTWGVEITMVVVRSGLVCVMITILTTLRVTVADLSAVFSTRNREDIVVGWTLALTSSRATWSCGSSQGQAEAEEENIWEEKYFIWKHFGAKTGTSWRLLCLRATEWIVWTTLF